MSIIGDCFIMPSAHEIPGKFQELQYIHLDTPTSEGFAGFLIKTNISQRHGETITVKTKFFCDAYSNLPGNYGFVITYGRASRGAYTGCTIRNNGLWYLRRSRNNYVETTVSVATNAISNIEVFDQPNNQYLKINSTTIATATYADDIISPADIFVGGFAAGSSGFNMPGRYYRVEIYDADGLLCEGIPVRNKNDNSIGYLTIDRWGDKAFNTATIYGTVSSDYITAGPDVT